MRASVRFITVIILQLLFVELSSVWATPSNAHSPSMDSASQNHTFYQSAEATPSPSSNCNPLQPIHTNCQYAPSIHEDTHDSHHLSILPNASAPAPTNTQFPHTQHLTQATNTVTNYSNTNHNTTDSRPLNHSQAPTSKDSEDHQSHPDFDRFVNADSTHFAHHSNDLHTESIKIAGDKFDEAIVKYMRKAHKLYIGERTAEELKMTIGTAFPREEVISRECRGRDLVTGLPKSVEVTSEEM